MSDSRSAVVPGAGRAERFGSQKLLADLDGEPLLNHTLRSLLDAGLQRVVLVVSRELSLASVSLASDPRVTSVVNPDPSRGMFSSIQTGLALVHSPLIAVLPADMPFVRSESVRKVLDYCDRTAHPVIPLFHGRHGHPLALPGRLREALLAADPNHSLTHALAALGAERDELAIDDPGIVRDVDTRADLTDTR
jgi:molybdenum cofactor cytidylyltransferase